jgi:hypothetical protein
MRKVFAMSSLTPRVRGCRVAHWLPAVPLCVSHDMVMDQVSQSSRTSPLPSHLITVLWNGCQGPALVDPSGH